MHVHFETNFKTLEMASKLNGGIFFDYEKKLNFKWCIMLLPIIVGFGSIFNVFNL